MNKKVRKRTNPFAVVSRYLHAQSQLILAADGSDEVVESFLMISKFLKRTSQKELLDILSKKESGTETFQKPTDFSSLSLDHIAEMVSDVSVPRKILEQIATQRFHVPKGSMRSYQSNDLLREKLSVLMENARTHEAIADIAGRE